MSQTFEQLGLRTELTQAAAAQGVREPTTLQTSAIPVLRRGGNLVITGSTGAGITMAYALPLIERMSQESSTDAPRLLVLVPTEDRATRKAVDLSRIAATVGMRAAALSSGWGRKNEADIVVATPDAARQAVERSQLKLDALLAFVMVDASTQLGEARDTVNALMTSIPRDAQRVVITAELNSDIEKFVESFVRKAMNVPARSDEGAPGAPGAPRAPEASGDLDYMVVPESRKESLLVRILEEQLAARPVVVVRSDASADELLKALTLRGFKAGAGSDSEVRVVTAHNAAGASNEISYDVPFEKETLQKVHATGGLVLVTPPELPHLRRMANAVGLSLKAQRVQPSSGDGLVEYRRMLRQAVHDEDVDAQMAVLDPLFDEFSPAEVAAALSALLRKRVVPRAGAASSQNSATAVGAPRPASAEAGFVRLFMSVGSRDNVRPGDLVGALTGEAGITGDQVGKVDIKDTYTVVELATSVADKVIRAMNGTTMRGRSLRVDYDRKGLARQGETGPRDSGRSSMRGDRPPRREGSGRDGPRREGPGRDAPRREGPGRDAPRRDGPRRDGPRRDGPSGY